MIKIVMIVPFDEMEELAFACYERLLGRNKGQAGTAPLFDFSVVRAMTTAEVVALDLDADVLIARGGTAYDLQRSNFHMPIVELQFGGSDMLATLIRLKKKYNKIPTAVIGSPNMFTGLEEAGEYLQMSVTWYMLKENTEEEIYTNVEKAISDGCKVIVGGMRGCTYARNFGADAMLIYSGEASVTDAISMAMQIGMVSRQNKEIVLGNQAMLDNAYEGLIALDKNNYITALNSSAQRILNITPGGWCIGMHIRDVLHSQAITNLVNNPAHYIDEIIIYNQTHMSFKKIAILLRQEVVGNVLTFLNATQIQETEVKLRDKLHLKGHVAKYTFASIIGNSPAIKNAIRIADTYAKTSSNIMLVGETGTGKELFSQSIHSASFRRDQPFVAVNCASIPENLLESELFGYVAGAFTGASKEGKMGVFELAHKGTLFLDEISEMPLSLQGRLLRVLQEREIVRLGHDKVIPVDVRVLTATNKELREQVRLGLFREDLFYRIYVLSLNLPPLRNRREDVAVLTQYYIERYCNELGKERVEIAPDVLDLIAAQPWPGNVRELRNFCERLVVLHQGNSMDKAFVFEILSYGQDTTVAEAIKEPQIQKTHSEEEFSQAFLVNALEEAGGNKTLAAQRLGISRVTFWRQMKKHEGKNS